VLPQATVTFSKIVTTVTSTTGFMRRQQKNAATGSMYLMKILQYRGPSLGCRDKNIRSVLHHAVLGALLEANYKQRTVLRVIPHGRTSLLRRGIFSESDWESVDHDGESPLYLIARLTDYNIVLPGDPNTFMV
jgi:hypothetical protein